MSLLKADNLHKRYDGGTQAVSVLAGLEFAMDEGDLVGVYGASGAGKSTFLHVLGGIDSPDEGSVTLLGKDLYGMGEAELAGVRNRSIGFVFQFYHLLGEFTALENAMIPCLIAGEKQQRAQERAMESLEQVGLSHRATHRPSELSGGEQQRVALARAAVMRPRIILADEPTGNLDRHTGNRVWEFLLKLNRDAGIGMVVVSHNHELLDQLSKVYELKDGTLQIC